MSKNFPFNHRSRFIPDALAGLLLLVAGLSFLAAATPRSILHVEGTFDLDRDGLSELLLIVREPRGGTALDYVEIDKVGTHHSLWTYTPPSKTGGIFSDAKMIDLNGDGVPELVATLPLSLDGTEIRHPWLFAFRWVGDTFTSLPLAVDGLKTIGLAVRPGNLHQFQNPVWDQKVLAVSMGSPSRQVVLLGVLPDTQPMRVVAREHLQPALLKNGYGRVLGAAFKQQGNELLAVISPEANLLKVALYTLTPQVRELAADVLSVDGARNVFAPGIMRIDRNADGDEELLLPFRTGEIMILSYSGEELRLEPSPLDGRDLFLVPDPVTDQEINSMVLARVESGLYETILAEPLGIASVTKQEVEALPPDRLEGLIPEDTLRLGDTFSRALASDSAAGFYSFAWLKRPPRGSEFNPLTGIFTWKPTRDQVGGHILAYRTENRVGEKILLIEEPAGSRHQIVPVLSDTVRKFALLVQDTAVIAPFPPLPEAAPRVVELYSVAALIPARPQEQRFIFEGEPPFGMHTAKFDHPGFESSVMHSITADLARVTTDKQIAFAYAAPEARPEQVTTLSVIHDLATNLLSLSLLPSGETQLQSANPRDLFPELDQFPEYLFAGFPRSVEMDLVGDKLRFAVSKDSLTQDTQLSFVGVTSPTNPAHLLTLYFNRGQLAAIRGDVKVRQTGVQKIVTKFEFTGDFNPVRISTQLRREKPPRPATSPELAAAAEREIREPDVDPDIMLRMSRSTVRHPVSPPDTAGPLYSLRFQPGDYVKIYDNPVFDFASGALTLEGWLYLDSGNLQERIISKDQSFHLMVDDQRRLKFWTARAAEPGQALTSQSRLPKNQWIHFAAVQDSLGMRLFINGVKDSENQFSGLIPRNTNPLYFGGWEFFTGNMDEVRLSNRGRYQSDFRPAGRLEPDAHTVGLWRMDNGRGILIADFSGFGNTGEVFGARWSQRIPGQEAPDDAPAPVP